MTGTQSSIADGPRPGQILPSLAIVASGALWGLFWVPLRHFDDHGVNAGWASAMFFVVTLAAVLPFVARALPRFSRGDLIAGVLTGSAFTLYTVSLVHTEVVRALLLFYLTPVWSTLLGFVFMGHAVTRHRLVALVLGIVGLLVVLDFRAGIPWPRNAGDWMALASGFVWACGTIGLHARGATRIPDTVFAFAIGGLLSSLGLLALPPLGLGAAPAGEALGAMLPLVLVFAFFVFVPTNVLILWGSQRLNPGRVGVLLMSECVVGTGSAALFAGEPFGPREAVGSVLIIGAGAVEVIRRSARA